MILIVDDSSVDLMIAKSIVEKIGFETICITNPSSAINRAAHNKIDVILLDNLMPEKTGLELASELKANPLTKNIPIIMVTGYDDSETIINALQIGVSDFIKKPYTKAKIEESVRKHAFAHEAQQEWSKLKRIANCIIDKYDRR